MHRNLLLLFCFFILSACAAKEVVKEVSTVPENAEVSLSQGDARIGSYVSSWKGFRTSSYWIEGPTGLIIIDTQFLLSASEEMLNWAEQTTGKKAQLAIILHPNPDKFNGTAIYQKRGIKVVTSDQVLKHIPSVHKLRTGWFYERFKPDYPVEEPKPESFGSQTTELEAGGIKVKAHVFGKGASDAHVVVEYDGNFFVGDLVTIGFHSWLELGYVHEWLKTLETIRAMEPKFVRTGRGGSGDSDSIRREEKYLRDVIRVVKSFKPHKGQKFSEKNGEKMQSQIEALYPSYEYGGFITNGLEAIWKNLAQ